MSLELKSGIIVKSFSGKVSGGGKEFLVTEDGKEIMIVGDIILPMQEFLQAVLYALTNNPLDSYNDPKKLFIETVKNMVITKDEEDGSAWIVLKGDEKKPHMLYSFFAAGKLQE